MNKSFLKELSQKLPFNRVMIYLAVLGSLPIIFTAFHYLQKNREWDVVSEQINAINYLSETKARRQYFNTIVRNVYADSDPLYLENQLESLTFLKKERETLEQLLQSPTFTGNESAEKRYSHLTSSGNRLEFLQGSPQISEGIQETVCWLSHSVEMDSHDLKELLTRLEGNRKGRPQVVITDLKCQKKSLLSGNEVFEVNIKLLKREFPL